MVLLWAIALWGLLIPAPSVRGLGGSQTRGMHNGIGGLLGEYIGMNTPVGSGGWSMVLDGWAAWENMLVAGEVVIVLLGNESTSLVRMRRRWFELACLWGRSIGGCLPWCICVGATMAPLLHYVHGHCRAGVACRRRQ